MPTTIRYIVLVILIINTILLVRNQRARNRVKRRAAQAMEEFKKETSK